MRRYMQARAALLGALLVLTAAVLGAPMGRDETAARIEVQPMSSHPLRAIGYIAYWDQDRAVAGIRSRTDASGLRLTHVSPSWYAPTADGRVIRQRPDVNDSPAVVAAMKRDGVRVVPAIANYVNKRWSNAAVSAVLANRATRTRLVRNLVALAVNRGFHGWDIDFEHLRATDRANLSAFARQLAAALHARGKMLAVTVHPKRSEPGPQAKNRAQDYAALAAAADELRVMLYDYHWETSAPGPVAPMWWVRAVTRFALAKVPRSKLVLGFATYGYLWPTNGSAGESHMYAELARLAAAKGKAITYHPAGGSTFSYPGYVAWLEDARSLRRKVSYARSMGVRGVHFWRLGGEDTRIWQ